MNTKSLTRLVAAASLTAGLAVAMTVPAQAQGGGKGVSSHGSCSATSVWKLQAKGDDGKIEVEAEVDSNVAGQTWKWQISDNGQLAAKGTSVTKARSGSFDVRRLIADAAGTDVLGLTATNHKTGETCTGSLTL